MCLMMARFCSEHLKKRAKGPLKRRMRSHLGLGQSQNPSLNRIPSWMDGSGMLLEFGHQGRQLENWKFGHSQNCSTVRSY